MKKYLTVLRLGIAKGIQYRFAALAGVATQFFFGFIFIMMYQAFYASSRSLMPMALDQVVTYIWLQQAFLVFIMLWFRDAELFNLITSGNIAYELCRPCSLYGYWYSKLLSQRLSGALLRCFPILLAALLLPGSYRLGLPPDITTFFLFLITLFLGLFILVAISMFIYISVFITLSPAGSTLMISVIGEFFSGLVIPIPLMPDWLQRIVNILPFRLSCDLPFRVYTGHIPQSDALVGILLQLLWLFVLIALGKAAMSKVLQNVTVQGG